MNKTPNYQLNQWDKGDRIMMEDFNADNAKIEAALASAGNCKFAFGSYIGTGTYGTANPNTLTFDFVPKLLVIMDNTRTITSDSNFLHIIWGYTEVFSTEGKNNDTVKNYLSFSGNTVHWYNENSAIYQHNFSGDTYHYFAIG